jgi:hypothetical protein
MKVKSNIMMLKIVKKWYSDFADFRQKHMLVKKGLSFLSNRQQRKEGIFCASDLAGIEPTPARSRRAGYARLYLSATGGMSYL